MLDKNNNNNMNSSTEEEEDSALFAATTSGLHLKRTQQTKRINVTGVGCFRVGTPCPWSTKTRKIYHLMLLLMIFLGASSVTQTNGDISPHYLDTPYSPPYFDSSTKRKVTAGIGQSALLHCRVRNLGDRAVSWIRKRDLHILTVGILTYTNDQRFQSLHTEGSDEWTLKISSPQPRDSGTYECQVSTEPKISQAFRLNVVASRAKILGNSELYIKSGSNINLTCLTMQTTTAPSFIYWYKGKQLINYSQAGGAINVITDRQTRTSNLLIAKASPADNGNYTCSPSNSDSASVTVHVIKGEHSAAMHHEEGNISSIAASTMDPSINKFHIVSIGLTTIFTINNLFFSFFRNENHNHLIPGSR